MSAPGAAAAPRPGLCSRVLCGVDDSAEGLVAAGAAARLTEPRGRLELLSVVADPGRVLLAERALTRALARATGPYAVRARRPEGRAIDVLLATLEREQATLAVVGSRGHSRPTGIVLGSVTTFLLHEAPCSVLVAREGSALSRWPRTIVVGVDGSAESVAALEETRALAGRFGASVRPIAATGDPRLDPEQVLALAPDVELHDVRPVHALAVAAEDADLVVVGSRGLRGIHAFSSVSERVAHEAPCSVLVVRPS